MPRKNTPISSRRRCRPLRVENDEFLWFVSSRTIEERFWLHPLLTCAFKPTNRKTRRLCEKLNKRADKRLAKVVQRANARRGPLQPELTLEHAKRIAQGLVGSAIARAQQKYKTKLFALVVLSNHFHLIVQTKGKNLSKFMGYVKARITEGINLLTGKSGPLWSRRYDAQPILDDEASTERLAYCLDNPVQAGLVESADQWPGLNCAFAMGDSDEIEFEYLDRTAWHKAGRPDDLDKYYRTATMKLTPLPQLTSMQRSLVRRSVESWLGSRGKERKTGGRFLGIEAILDTAFESRPKEPKRSRRPYAFGSIEKKRDHYQSISMLYGAHETASERFRNGDFSVSFPEGMYRPPIMVAA
jgi:REP element-mobilizing transposase RayT